MSALGNYYVHYYAKNYQREGILDLKGEGKGKSPELKDLQLKDNYIDSKYKNNFNVGQRKEKVQKIEKLYQQMLYGDTSESIQFREKMMEALNSMLYEKFGDGAGKVHTQNLLVANIDNNATTQLGKQTLDKLAKPTVLLGQSIRKIISDVRSWLNIIQQNSGTAQQLEQKLGSLSRVKGQLTKIENIIGQSNKGFSANSYNYPKLKKYIEAISEIDVPVVSTRSNQQGEIGEWITPWLETFLSYKCKEISSIAVDQLIQIANKQQLGKTGAWIAYQSSKNGIKKIFEKTKKPEKTTIKGKVADLVYDYHTSKADAQLFLHNKELQGLELPSIKNYSSFKNLSIVDGTSLNDILDRSLNSAWAAHYVNTTVSHPDDESFLTQLRVNAQKSFNKLTLYIALIGYTKSNAATLFIVFNNQAKQVKVFDPYILMGELLDSNNANYNFNIITDNGSAKVNLSSGGLIPQNFAKTKNIRNKDIQTWLHSYKIHTSISLASN